VSAIQARTGFGHARFDNAWRNEPTGHILSHVSLGGDAWLVFDSAATAREVAAECIKAAEAMEQIEAAGGTAAPAAGKE
jgi:hypothetical protein